MIAARILSSLEHKARIGLGLLLLAISMATPRGDAAPSCSAWLAIPDPPKPSAWNAFAATSPSDIWAVGWVEDVGGHPSRVLGSRAVAARWDGSRWQTAAAANPPHSYWSELADVAMTSPRDGWTVGFVQPKASGPTYPLIEHWDGLRWTLTPSPRVNIGVDGGLSGVTAVSTRDAWAVGSTVIEHWDGRRWRVVKNPGAIPRPGLADGTLNSVAALSSHDVWAVGAGSIEPKTIEDIGQPLALTEHWDGRRWRIVPGPDNPNAHHPALVSLSAVSASDVWTVGGSQEDPGAPVAIVGYWDGKQWMSMDTPLPDPGGFSSVVALSATDVWADNCCAYLYHWNGYAWMSRYTDKRIGGGIVLVPSMSPHHRRAVVFIGYPVAAIKGLVGPSCLRS